MSVLGGKPQFCTTRVSRGRRTPARSNLSKLGEATFVARLVFVKVEFVCSSK